MLGARGLGFWGPKELWQPFTGNDVGFGGLGPGFKAHLAFRV